MSKSKTKRSLVNIFILLFSILITIFILINLMSYFRLIEHKNILDNIIKSSIPKIIHSSNIYSQVNELSFLIEKLNKSKTQTFRTVTYEKIVNKIHSIKELGNDISNNDINLLNKLDIIQSELIQLNSLINERLIIQNRIEEKTANLYDLNDEVILNKEVKNSDFININNWKLNFGDIINLTYQSLSLTKLSHLRHNINELNRLKIVLDNEDNKKLTEYNLLLNEIVFKENGLLELKLKQLKTNGRTTGRGNFVNNLVKDFSAQVGYYSFKSNKEVIKKAENNFKNIESEINYMLIVFVFALIYLVLVIFYINKKIVQRLVSLNNSMKKRLSGHKFSIIDKQKDEISQIVHTLNYYSNKVDNQKSELEKLSLTDQLTSISNRRSFDIYFDDCLKQVKRYNISLSILLIDIDYFKKYNDYYGHLAGDDALRKVANTIKDTLKRSTDLTARYGGEEFICLLPDTNNSEAKLIAKEILENILKLKIKHEKSDINKYLTVSIGVNTVLSKEDDLNVDNILKNTDRALYNAKANGRNCYK